MVALKATSPLAAPVSAPHMFEQQAARTPDAVAVLPTVEELIQLINERKQP